MRVLSPMPCLDTCFKNRTRLVGQPVELETRLRNSPVKTGKKLVKIEIKISQEPRTNLFLSSLIGPIFKTIRC